jgi:sugar phosphate isomerase/epimerase
MTEQQVAAVKQKLSDAGIQVTAFGVVGLSENEAESRRVFDWCKTMGVKVINTEVERSAFDVLEKLCEEYQIKVALHNHPKPSIYWNPDTIMEALEGRSAWLGACADTGHWLRSDLNPVECLKKLEGRIHSMHFKDLNKTGSGAHDVPWGEGVGDVPAILAEMKRQKFSGPISVEYEHNWLNSLPEVGQCVQNFHRMTAELK